MSKLDQLGTASNEARNQRIMLLKQAFNRGEVKTVQSALTMSSQWLIKTKKTLIDYCIAGDIPLIDAETAEPVVPLTEANTPQWLADIMGGAQHA